MKTYLYATYSDEGFIELVRKDEHDAIVQELNERLTQQQADMLDTIVQRQLEITKWQSMAERLATALDNLSHDCTNHSKDIPNIRWGHDGDCGANLSAEQIEECCDAVKPALAAYESIKKGAPQMFTPCESCEAPLVCSELGNCSAAKGEQP